MFSISYAGVLKMSPVASHTLFLHSRYLLNRYVTHSDPLQGRSGGSETNSDTVIILQMLK